MNQDIVVVGSVAFDDIETIKGRKNRLLGGSGIYFSLASSLFSKTHLIGIVGDDFNQDDIEMLHSKSISTHYLVHEQGQTFSWGGKYSDDFSHRETLFTELGVFQNFNPIIDTSQIKNPILFLANIQPSLQDSVLNQIDNASLIVMDTMNLWIDNNYDELIQVIKKVDILLINDEEIRELTKEKHLWAALEKLYKFGLKYIIIKEGSKGSTIGSPLIDQPEIVSAMPNIDVFDPTGAGDSFAGGFLGYLSSINFNHENIYNDIKQAVIYGTAIASYTVSDFGINGIKNLGLDNIKKRVKLIEELKREF